MICLVTLTIIERLTTQHILTTFGHSAEAPRILLILIIFSCGTPLWCYFNAFTWRTLWSMQVQLASEKESSKSLLSMVCDATFWLSEDGDTILHSSRQLDAILGC